MLPTVLDLHSHLMDTQHVRYCKPVTNALLASLRKQFSGIFHHCRIPQQQAPQSSTASSKLQFSDTIYPIARVLDPQFFFHWVDMDMPATNNSDLEFAARIKSDIKDSA